jgi:hypothetical protein
MAYYLPVCVQEGARSKTRTFKQRTDTCATPRLPLSDSLDVRGYVLGNAAVSGTGTRCLALLRPCMLMVSPKGQRTANV